MVVEGINMVKRHTKPNPQRNVQGGIVEKETSIDLSNVALWNPVTKKGDRVGIRTLADGKKGALLQVQQGNRRRVSVGAGPQVNEDG